MQHYYLKKNITLKKELKKIHASSILIKIKITKNILE